MTSILVVEDQPVMASIYRSKFLAEGFQVEVATDGEQALDLVTRTKPDLVLLDLNLPKIKGLDVLKMLRANESFKTLPILVFSGSSQPGVVEEAWTAGATLVLSKTNTSPKQMIESAHSALARGAAYSSARNAEPASGDLKKQPDEAQPLKVAKRSSQILLVEKNPEFASIVSHLLIRGGQKILKTQNHEQAVLLSEVNHIDLVLVNRDICRDSIRSFCQQIRERQSTLPVVMYAMAASGPETDEALSSGISRILTTPEELLDVARISEDLIDAKQTVSMR